MSAHDLSPDQRSTEIPTNSAGYPLARCKACRALVFFAETLAGKHQIIDAEPSPVGNIQIDNRGEGRLISLVFSGQHLESQRNRGAELYLDHHATCPNATHRGGAQRDRGGPRDHLPRDPREPPRADERTAEDRHGPSTTRARNGQEPPETRGLLVGQLLAERDREARWRSTRSRDAAGGG